MSPSSIINHVRIGLNCRLLKLDAVTLLFSAMANLDQ